jgi:putative SOS response-associated peptidase YedK
VIWDLEAREDGPFYSFVMVTVPANALIGTITDRMPAVVQLNDWPKWLGVEDVSAEERKAMFRPSEGDWTMRPQEKPAKPRPKAGFFDP